MATQALLALRVVWRLLHTGREAPISSAVEAGRADSIAVIIPVLNEATRLTACLDSVMRQGPEVSQIVVVDGGSTDATTALAREAQTRDARLRLVEAGPAPDGWNGKVWGLSAAEAALLPATRWVLVLDADTRSAPLLARSLVSRATERRLRFLSVATTQHLSGPGEAVLHPAMLTTLVYRFGRPGTIAGGSGAAIANGQCLLISRDLLAEIGGFSRLKDSLCEDMTVARLAARAGEAVGFYEAPALIEVAMYTTWRDAWRNWPRSLPTRDALFGVSGWIGLAEVLLVQALPLPLLLIGHSVSLNLLLLAIRFGMLAGIARAYSRRPLTYWLSPLLDLPVAIQLWRSALRRHHTWRGRAYVQRHGALIAA